MERSSDNTRYHVHDHTSITSCDQEHSHMDPGVTGIPIPRDRTHYHEIIGATTYQDRHFHTYRATTGPAVALPNGYHTHYASFTTSYDSGHRHRIMGFVEAIMDEGLYDVY